MTVSDLIAKLLLMPRDERVFIFTGEYKEANNELGEASVNRRTQPGLGMPAGVYLGRG